MIRSREFGYVSILMGLIALGCTGQPAVNRVQPGAIEKAVLRDSQWYFLQTVIDSPYSAPYAFVGQQGDTEKIEWEIQEELLIARRSYEYIAVSEPEGIAGSTEEGAVVAMYKIESHFDIRRDYNPVTGEETNVIVENDRDRPWNKRDYFRVDWSENLISNNFLLFAKLFDGIRAESVSYFVEPGSGHPHEPKFDMRENEEGESEVYYIDIVNKMFVEPTNSYLEELDMEIPTCLLTKNSHLDCASAEITVRNSFLRVDAKHDYEPFAYTGDRMERFGYFVSERAGRDDQGYGVVEPERFRFTNRHNLWKESHRRAEDGEFIRCVDDAGCGGASSRCDIAWAKAHRERNAERQWLGACTIPYREREVRPIAYHLSQNFPEDLISDAKDVARHWNSALSIPSHRCAKMNVCLKEEAKVIVQPSDFEAIIKSFLYSVRIPSPQTIMLHVEQKAFALKLETCDITFSVG